MTTTGQSQQQRGSGPTTREQIKQGAGTGSKEPPLIRRRKRTRPPLSTSATAATATNKPAAYVERPYVAQQANLVALLLHDDVHGKTIAAQVEAAHFEGDFRELARRALDFWKQYGEAPKAHCNDIVADILEDASNPNKAKAFRRLLLLTAQEVGRLNRAYVLDDLELFKATQEYKAGILRMAELAQAKPSAETLEQMQELARQIGRSRDTKFDAGLALGDTEHLLEHLAARADNEFVTGIRELDRRHVVPTRKTIMVLLGATTAGKSWWLVNLGRRALWNRQKKVLHVSLELSQEQVQQRYWQSLLALPQWQNDLQTTCTRLQLDDNGRLIGLVKDAIKASCSMQDERAFRRELKQYNNGWLRRVWGNLKIKQFATRGLSVGQLHGYLDQLAASGFVPDLLLLDYAALMQSNVDQADSYRIALGRVIEELRGLAVERDLALVTVHQVSKEGARKPQVNMTHVAEDWSIPGTVDFVLSLTRTDEEKRHKLARIWVDKNRLGAHQDFGVVLSQNYQHGQFCLESAPLIERARYDQLIAGLGGVDAKPAEGSAEAEPRQEWLGE
jgi:replicative DNA helicase